MIRRTLALTAIAVGAIALFSARPVSAAPVIQSGDTVDGWKISFPAGIALNTESSGSNLVLGLEKFADFSNTTGLPITFTQVGFSGEATQISILNESITNSTGSSFGGFQFLLLSPLNGGQNFASTFSTIAPWTTSTPGSGNSISLSGGTLVNGSTAFLGGKSSSDALVINADPVGEGLPANFSLKEIPIAGGTNPVPLPAAAWSGAFGVLGVVIFNVFAKRRKLI